MRPDLVSSKLDLSRLGLGSCNFFVMAEGIKVSDYISVEVLDNCSED